MIAYIKQSSDFAAGMLSSSRFILFSKTFSMKKFVKKAWQFQDAKNEKISIFFKNVAYQIFASGVKAALIVSYLIMAKRAT